MGSGDEVEPTPGLAIFRFAPRGGLIENVAVYGDLGPASATG